MLLGILWAVIAGAAHVWAVIAGAAHVWAEWAGQCCDASDLCVITVLMA